MKKIIINVNHEISDNIADFWIFPEIAVNTYNYCDLRDDCGSPVGCENAGCEGDNHIQCKAITYWDGHNWKHILLEHPFQETHSRITDEKLIEKILNEYEQAEFPPFYVGFSCAETENYEFRKSLFPNSPELVSVIKL